MIRPTWRSGSAATASAIARYVLPVPAGPIPKVTVQLADRVDVALLRHRLRRDLLAAVAPDDVVEDLADVLRLVERAERPRRRCPARSRGRPRPARRARRRRRAPRRRCASSPSSVSRLPRRRIVQRSRSRSASSTPSPTPGQLGRDLVRDVEDFLHARQCRRAGSAAIRTTGQRVRGACVQAWRASRLELRRRERASPVQRADRAAGRRSGARTFGAAPRPPSRPAAELADEQRRCAVAPAQQPDARIVQQRRRRRTARTARPRPPAARRRATGAIGSCAARPPRRARHRAVRSSQSGPTARSRRPTPPGLQVRGRVDRRRANGDHGMPPSIAPAARSRRGGVSVPASASSAAVDRLET